MLLGIFLLAMLLSAFFIMARYGARQALVIPILACLALGLQGEAAEAILRKGFSEFSIIVANFTAVAVGAHLIARSNTFDWMAAQFGAVLGNTKITSVRLAVPIACTCMLATTYVLAALLHNTTSILIATPIAIQICSRYGLPSRWLLSGLLIASNLGGFSTSWGDTPNIIEAHVWGLSALVFLREILPINLTILIVLIAVVVGLTLRDTRDDQGSALATALVFAGYRQQGRTTAVDRRALFIGLATLIGFIGFQVAYPRSVIVGAAIAIGLATLLTPKGDRYRTLMAIEPDVYAVFASIFVLAGCVERSWIGDSLQALVANSGAAPWSIALSGYFGTTFTEAASWASAASARIYPLAPSHADAWALGGGICAGSSSILTAASAGIILAMESRRAKDPTHEMTFGRYLGLSIPFSIFMLGVYIAVFSIWR